VRITGPKPYDPVEIETGIFSDPADFKAMLQAIQICRELGNSAAFAKREVMPGNLAGPALESFVRNTASSGFHQSGTAKMGCDDMSVVDSRLQVYGIDRLRIADASIMPRVPTGNTMAPCVVIGEKAAEFLVTKHGLCS
jgi:choline dehydrogenase